MPVDDNAQGQGNTGTGTGDAGSQSTGQQGTTGQPTTGQPAGTTTGQTGTPTASQFSYAEDRSRWIPPHRLTETARRAQELEGQLTEAQQRIRALAGVQAPDPQGQRAEQIRDAFFALPGMARFKKLMDLGDDQFEQLLQAPSTVEQSQQAEARRWAQHGDSQIAKISESVADAIGAAELDADQTADLRVSFSAWLRNAVNAELQAAGSDKPSESTILRRYEAGDPKLTQEFVTRYTKNWVTPAQRQSAARTVNRTRPVPNSGGRSMTTSVNRPEKFKSLDERLDYAVNALKEQGVQFGR